MSFPIHPLDKALGDITSIRRQVARTTEFRGYGAATLAATGMFAIVAAVAQAFLLPDPVNHIGNYLRIWITTAILSAILIGMQTLTRTRRIHSGLADEMILMAVEQFLPSVGAGALISVVLVRFVPGSVWMLPGLWQITFSLGVFCFLQVPAKTNDRRRLLVPAHGSHLHRPRRHARSLSMDHGHRIRHRPVDRRRGPPLGIEGRSR